MTKKQSRLDPNRFKQEPQLDNSPLFSFDPIRRDLFIKGLAVGAVGAFFMTFPQFLSQLIGMMIVVLVSNYYIQQGARRISRWHAMVMTFSGLMIAMFVVLTLGNMAMVYYLGTR